MPTARICAELELSRSPICPASSSGGRGRTARGRRRTRSTGIDVRGKAVLVAHRLGPALAARDAYFGDHPFLTAAAAEWLVDDGAALVGIDSHNIDDTRVRARPVHTALLGAGIPICEHMTGLGALPDERLPLHRGPAQGQRHGDVPGARLRRDRLSLKLQPVGNDRVVGNGVDPAMLDRQAELADSRTRVRGPVAVAFDHDQPAVDLLPPVHPRGILLADEAALGEADAVQFGGIAFEPEEVAELGAAFADAEAQAMLEPAAWRARRRGASQRRPSAARRGSGTPSPSVRRPMDRQRRVALDRGSGGAGDRSPGA